MNAETFAELVEEGQVKGDPTKGVKHTENLPWVCGGREISVAFGVGTISTFIITFMVNKHINKL